MVHNNIVCDFCVKKKQMYTRHIDQRVPHHSAHVKPIYALNARCLLLHSRSHRTHRLGNCTLVLPSCINHAIMNSRLLLSHTHHARCIQLSSHECWYQPSRMQNFKSNLPPACRHWYIHKNMRLPVMFTAENKIAMCVLNGLLKFNL